MSLPSSFSYGDRWERALSSQEVGRVAKFLIESELDFAMDTSCAERWSSLMNLVKYKRRNWMNTALLNDLMFICTHWNGAFVCLYDRRNRADMSTF